jgi:hypothetical protein
VFKDTLKGRNGKKKTMSEECDVKELPDEVERMILTLSFQDEKDRISAASLVRHLLPVQGGGLDRPFFTPGSPLLFRKTDKNFPIPQGLSLPRALLPLIQTYGSNISFTTQFGVLFLSADECRERRTDDRFTPFALKYIGMGHIRLFIYDERKEEVLSFMNGGSNNYDRAINQTFMKETLDMYKNSNELPEDVKRISFHDWWENAVAMIREQ